MFITACVAVLVLIILAWVVDATLSIAKGAETGVLNYDQGCHVAVKENKPLIVFSKQEVRPIKGCISCRWDETPDPPSVRIMLPAWIRSPSPYAICRDGSPTTEAILKRVSELQFAAATRQKVPESCIT
jgi:hypothetical protein